MDGDHERPVTRAGTGSFTDDDASTSSELVFATSTTSSSSHLHLNPPSSAGTGASGRRRTRRGQTMTTMSDLQEEEEYESDDDEDVFAFGPPTTADQNQPSAPTAQASHPQHQQQQQHNLTLSLLPSVPSSDPFFYQNQLTSLPSVPYAQSTSAAQPIPTHSYPADIKPPISLIPVESPPQTNSTASADAAMAFGSNVNNTYRMRPVSIQTSTPDGTETQVGYDSVGLPTSGSKKDPHDRDIYTSSSFYPSSFPGPTHSYTHDSGLSGVSSTSGAGSIKMEFDFDNLGIGGDDEEDSPYPEVRASVSNIDDPEMPALTFRMWIIGLFLCFIAGGANVFFNFRNPAPSIPPLVTLLLAYPLGKFLAYSLPIRTFKFPELRVDSLPMLCRWPKMRGKVLGGWEFSLNPGPWNIKEHVLCYIMANVTVLPPYAMTMIVVSEQFYNIRRGFGFNLVLVFATQLTGFGLAGLCRRFLVWPASMVWPQNLVVCTLLNTLHAEDDQIVPPSASATGLIGMRRGISSRITSYFSVNSMSRYKFFMLVLVASWTWFWIPGYLWTGLSIFSWACWIKPDNVVVNQLFGVSSGLGMGILTFDWTEISWIGSPLAVPWWAQCHVFVGFVLVYWILTPILYYTNVWDLSYFPVSNLSPYDRFGATYDVDRVLTPQQTFNLTAYENYSPLYLPATYAMTYLLAFAISTSIIVHTLLYHGRSLLNGVKKMRVEPDDIHAKLMRNYPEVPEWWYASVFICFFGLAIIMVEVWHTGVPVYILLLSVLLPMIYILPSGFIYAMTSQSINVNLIAQIIPGTLKPGNPLVNMLFKSYSIQTLGESLSFVQDLKLGHYIKVPPRATFTVQLVATTLAAVMQVGVKTLMFANIDDMCSPTQKSNLTCPHNKVFFTASAIWGLIGPSRQFGTSSIYHPQLYALAIGVVLPIPFWLWQRRFPNTRLKFINIPVLLNGIGFIPPATGINYSAWFGVGFVFQYLVRRRYFAWWSKFNYIMSAGLDCGTLLCVLSIFFFVVWPTGIQGPNWWGNTVWQQTADFNRTAFRSIPVGGIPPR